MFLFRLDEKYLTLRGRLQASPRAAQKKFPVRMPSQGNTAAVVEDPQMVDIAARFVQEIIEKARTEATAKMNSETLVR